MSVTFFPRAAFQIFDPLKSHIENIEETKVADSATAGFGMSVTTLSLLVPVHLHLLLLSCTELIVQSRVFYTMPLLQTR